MAHSKVELRESMQRYGKVAFSDKEQIEILYFILQDAKDEFAQDSEINKLISTCQSKLNDEKDLKKAIEFVNKFIIDLETKDHDRGTIDYLKKQGLYRIVYRNSQIMGEELPPDDILHTLLRNGFVGVGASALIILLFAATAFFAAPFWLTAIATGLFVGASVYLSGILYGVVNDLFATRANLPYFLLGHQPQQKSLLRTNDKVAQGIAWGVAATFGPVVIATVLFTVAATITAFFVPMATFLLPVMMIAMPLIAIGAEFYARKKAREYMQGEEILWMGSNEYQCQGLNYMCPTQPERAAWHANSDRNMFGFTKVPLIGLVGLVGLIVLSAISMFLPPLLFVSPIIAIAVPAAFAAAACVTLIAAGVYMYVNRNKQVDDRYRLEFDRAKIEPSLYLDEDMPYVESLVKKYSKRDPSSDLDSSVSDQANYGSIFDKKSAPKIIETLREGVDDGNGLGSSPNT
ncbi:MULTISPECIES: hypothetical protein [unclassified Legionella]|uniref:hypothetical protein n=1 Tax=unclassified Legionella TaxID=2622702 RepID=UPI001F5FD1E8|nr:MULTISPECIES: hypothetical protein [unclassified Legionella]MDI9819706.1 hypothetical protein [Legionella sp. PL877]